MEPRVVSPECGYVLPLVDLLDPYLGQRGVIGIHGPAGSGKTTALRHLAAVLPDRLTVFDRGADWDEVRREAGQGLVVGALRGSGLIAEFTMAPWGLDEALEYLMGVHSGQCADVMGRLAGAGDEFAGASPEIWCAVLDEMAGTIGTGPRDALANVLFRGPEARWCGYWLVPILREGRRIASRVLQADAEEWPAVPIAAALTEAVRLLARRDDAGSLLRATFETGDADRQPLAASLLVGLRDGWRPTDDVNCCLVGAHLADAPWSDVRLPCAWFERANLDRANLDSAVLDCADFTGAYLRAAHLDEATLTASCFDYAGMARARLRHARAHLTSFFAASLVDADLSAADLQDASLDDADLRNAKFVAADLSSASLLGAQIDGTDFSRANLTSAVLRRLNLRPATWTNARFDNADLRGCQLGGLALPDAEFDGADLTDAHLTASSMPRASFRGAKLRGARLADVAWEGADLRDADLSRANFHMGSSRSGLVDSIVPSEGSRTGYYTDEFNEQAFRAPEEIRKANLCGADLRGASVTGTDFYLVDLRGAKYDRSQADHFRSCGAILQTKRM